MGITNSVAGHLAKPELEARREIGGPFSSTFCNLAIDFVYYSVYNKDNEILKKGEHIDVRYYDEQTE